MTANPFLTSRTIDSSLILTWSWVGSARGRVGRQLLCPDVVKDGSPPLPPPAASQPIFLEISTSIQTKGSMAKHVYKRTTPRTPPSKAQVDRAGPACQPFESRVATTTKERQGVTDEPRRGRKGRKRSQSPPKSGRAKGWVLEIDVPLAESRPVVMVERWRSSEGRRERLGWVRRLPPHLGPPTRLPRRVSRRPSLRAPTERVRMRREVRVLGRRGEGPWEGERAGGGGEGGEVAEEGGGRGEPWRGSCGCLRRREAWRRSRGGREGGVARRGETPRGLSPDSRCTGLGSARTAERLVRDVRERLKGFGGGGRASGGAGCWSPDRSRGGGRTGTCRGEVGWRGTVA